MKARRSVRPAVREFEGEWYVRTDVVAPLHRKHVLMQGRAFAVTDAHGDFPGHASGELGLYWRGTRHLSVLELHMDGHRPLLLAAELSGDEREYEIEMTNPDLDSSVPRDVIYISRKQMLEAEELAVELTITSHHLAPVPLELVFEIASDWKDVFEVRGARRPARGKALEPGLTESGMVLSYIGLDGTRRWTEVALDPAPSFLGPGKLLVRLDLAPSETKRVVLCARPGQGEGVVSASRSYSGANAIVRRTARRWREETPVFRSSEHALERALARSITDLGLMIVETEDGPLPYAGIPWYAAAFGRDAVITALQLLPWRSDVAPGVLRYLAKRRATKRDDFTDAEPGKMLHELREGEMAALREIPFVPYYGSVDVTPLWLVLLEAYHSVSADDALVRELWPAALDALAWLDGPADPDKDGLVEYERRSQSGLVNQGWKDSRDAIHHADGRIASGPIAVVEVQAYAYAARIAMASLLERVHGDQQQAAALRSRAEELRAVFETRFWDEELGTYVIALDGEKRPCRVACSNAGHVLWAGAARPDHATAVAERLFKPDLFSGYGIRTLAEGSARYNPMSYHNGSIWPHDNALAAAGLRRYGDPDRPSLLLRALVDAAATFPLFRLPELFCGFRKRDGRGPVPYPVACSPQAWAAGALLQATSASLGVSVDARRGRVSFDDPRLPRGVEWLEVLGIAAGTRGSIDVRIRRGARFFAVEVVDKRGDVEVVIRKRGPIHDQPA